MKEGQVDLGSVRWRWIAVVLVGVEFWGELLAVLSGRDLVDKCLRGPHVVNGEKATINLSVAPRDKSITWNKLGWVPQPISLPEL